MDVTQADLIRAWTSANLRARMAYQDNHSPGDKCVRCGAPRDDSATTCRTCAIKHAERMRAYRASKKEKS